MTTEFKEKEFSDGVNLATWKKILSYLRPCKKYLIILLVLTFISSIMEALLPVFNKFAIDYFIKDYIGNTQLMVFMSAIIIGIIVQAILIYFIFICCGRIESIYGANLRAAVLNKTLHLSFSYFDKTPVGWILARLTSDITRIAEVFAWATFDYSWATLTMVSSLVVMLVVDYRFALIILVMMPILTYLTYFFQVKLLKYYRLVRMNNSRITGGFNEGINGAKTTKTLVLEKSNFNDFKHETSTMRDVSIKAGRLQAMYRPLVNAFSGLSMALILWFGGKEVLNINLPLGTLVMFCQFAFQFFEPLRTIAHALSELQMCQANAERVMALIDEPIDLFDSEQVIEKYGDLFHPKYNQFETIDGAVEFKHVYFEYIKNEPVIKDFSLSVDPKQTIALVGATGGGKSTIINLLCRFYEPVSGQILIDGIDYKDRSISWLHSQIGYVLQTPHLFSGTIAENIKYANPCLSDEKMFEVCKKINAHDFIMKLEKGYDSQVGEAGAFLSTGQKQLISFARALVNDPKIMILDEATSSIDTESEAIIQEALATIIGEITTFVVAHRLSTIVNADKILVIKRGEIVEIGNHFELINKKGHYYRLYSNQFNEQQQHEILGN